MWCHDRIVSYGYGADVLRGTGQGPCAEVCWRAKGETQRGWGGTHLLASKRRASNPTAATTPPMSAIVEPEPSASEDAVSRLAVVAASDGCEDGPIMMSKVGSS